MIDVLIARITCWRDDLKAAGKWDALDCWVWEKIIEAVREQFRGGTGE